MSRFFLLPILIAMCIMLMSGCADTTALVDTEELPEGALRDTVLYYETDAGYIIPVMKQIPWEEGIGVAALSYLVDSAANSEEIRRCGLKPVVPEGTTFELKIGEGKKATLNVKNLPNFDDEYKERVFLKSVVNTLTEFESIESVSIRFDGKKVEKMPNGTPVSDNMTSFELNPIDEDLSTSAADGMNAMTVYVPDKNCLYNIPMTQYTSENADFEDAMRVFCERCTSMNNGLPPDTQVLSATVTGNTAAVNFSEEFSEILTTTEGVPDAIYNAIYLTACEFGDISELKLFVESEKLPYEFETVSAPLYVNEWQ